MAIQLKTYYRSQDIPSIPGTNIFHSTEVMQLLEKTTGYDVLLIVAYDGDKVIGKLLSVTRSMTKLTRLLKKTIVYGIGEYFSDTIRHDVIFKEMLSHLVSLKKESTTLFEFRNIEESLFGYKYFRENRFFPVRWLRVINSLHHKTLDKWMSQSRKKHIANALKAGAELCVAETEEDLNEAFKMMRKYYSIKLYRYFPDITFFYSLLTCHSYKMLGRIFTVKYKGKVIGCSACIFSDKTAYLLFSGGMNKTYSYLYPCVLAIWKAMLFARSNGFLHLEFINAGFPFKKLGYRDFILRFGGKQVSSRRWYRLNSKFINNIMIQLHI